MQCNNIKIETSLNPTSGLHFQSCHECKSTTHCLRQNFLTANDRQPALPDFHKFRFKKGEYIYRCGDSFTNLYSIHYGYAKLEYCLESGDCQVHDFAVPGDLMGMDGITGGKYTLNVIALSDGEYCTLNTFKLNNLIRLSSAVLDTYQRMIGRFIDEISHHLFTLGSLNAEQKLAEFILHFHQRQIQHRMGIDSMHLPMSREDLKSYLGITNETLSRAFSTLENYGYLKVKNRDLTEINYENLQRFVNQTM